MAENCEVENLIMDLPDREGGRRFFDQLLERHPSAAGRLLKNIPLLSDLLALASFSPLLGTTILQNPAYIDWLKRRRKDSQSRDKEELLESLARFGLTNSQIEPQVLLARFRRRELLRIFLQDLRELGTIAEITEEISCLADAILEHALRIARQEMDNRFGFPLEVDDKGRTSPAKFCIVSLGKLGSKELNYSSDIDLIFIYSSEGNTAGHGSRGMVSNREYFVKLAELVNRLVGQQSGEGAAYRVDMRLRPHGRVGALAIALAEACEYYRSKARAWERQTLIRSRASAGDADVFKAFYSEVESSVFSTNETVEDALRNVKLSKERINLEHGTEKGYDVKLGPGGIREIEFIAQALQLAYGGKDSWLRTPHTLISLSRLEDRDLLTANELSELSGAYDFLRRLEHRLQMEQGLQTRIVLHEPEKRLAIARRMNFPDVQTFEKKLDFHSSNVHRVFNRVFAGAETPDPLREPDSGAKLAAARPRPDAIPPPGSKVVRRIFASLEKTGNAAQLTPEKLAALEEFCRVSPYFGEILTSNPIRIDQLPSPGTKPSEDDYPRLIESAIERSPTFADKLAELRRCWAGMQIRIAAFDVFNQIDPDEARRRQTALAEASISTALAISNREAKRIFGLKEDLNLAVMGLGKLGGRGMDYGSDLDLVLIYDDEKPLNAGENSRAAIYARMVEIFVTTLSGFTREGNLYRVDLRLRPDGKNGATSLSKTAFLNYLENRSAVWEWLAYVKIRAVSGDMALAFGVERSAQEIIHQKAVICDHGAMREECRRVRDRLEQKPGRGSRDIDIKFGAGGMLDVYFAIRYLQLRDNVRDTDDLRSTLRTLKRLVENGSLNSENFRILTEGYRFLASLDHNLRLTVGRSTNIPFANSVALQIIANRMKLDFPNELLEKLTIHRLNIRQAYENVLGSDVLPIIG